ncbi:MAG: nicotinate (nicotinamide) nucleotide adenylyltransferase [Planctomycetota bacterium]|jgi:nicotinate-nucleotide adenylyltransferase|nr:nicotinate (nicotinamide) nucleotide adenylyltransferase [Planctomycetota bacterium]
MRIAVFGGSFDPVHIGHLAVADAVQKQLHPDLLLWVPAGLAPHKLETPPTPATQRVALLELAIQGREGEAISRLEIERKGPSFMVDTLEALRSQYENPTLFLVMGGDSQAHFPTWRRFQRILELAEPIFFPRKDWEAIQPNMPGRMLPMEPVDIDSTELRRQLSLGKARTDAFPAGVLEKIQNETLYQT